jgi:hypothetical protein
VSKNDALREMLKTDLEELSAFEQGGADEADEDERGYLARRRERLVRQLALVESSPELGNKNRGVQSKFVADRYSTGYALFVPDDEVRGGEPPFVCFAASFFDADTIAHLFSKPMKIVPATVIDGGILIPVKPEDYDEFELLSELHAAEDRVSRKATAS